MSFAAELRKHRDLLARHRAEKAELEAAYHAATLHAFKARYPRRRKLRADMLKLRRLDEDLWAGVREHYEPLAGAMLEAHDAARKASEERRDRAAEGYAPEPTGGRLWTLLREVSSYTYSTQGWGAMRYARGAAEREAAHARYWGIAAEVCKAGRRRTYPGPGGSIDHGAFRVWVATDALGAEALRLKPGPGLREEVRACWARGVNPRVYNPFLPHGYEERAGIDYQGRETGRGPCLALVPVQKETP